MGKRRRSLSPYSTHSPAKNRSRPSISPPPLRRHQNSNPTLLAPAAKTEIEDRFEIISWNINGVSHLLKSDTPRITSFFNLPPTSKAPGSNAGSPLRKFLERHAWPQILGLQEVKINPQDASTKRALERAANAKENETDSGPAYTAHFSLPRDRYNAKGFGGKVHGVCTLLHTSLLPSSTTKEVDWDLEGRVLITDFPNWKLAVVNGYWVNGTTMPYRSTSTGAVIGTRHDRKREFHAQMLATVKEYEAKDWHVVLIGDMNVAPSLIDGYPNLRGGVEHVRNRRDFNEKFLSGEDGMRGVDTFRHFHGGTRKYSYHGEAKERWGESCDRVDLGIVSRSLVEGKGRGALVGADIWESVVERGASDHVPISVVLNVGKLRGREEEG